MVNVTGWNNLTSGKIVEASYLMFNTAFGGWFLILMYVILTGTLLIKTKNVTLVFVLGIIFFAMFYSSFNLAGSIVMTSILIFELAGSLYQIFFKN